MYNYQEYLRDSFAVNYLREEKTKEINSNSRHPRWWWSRWKLHKPPPRTKLELQLYIEKSS